MLTVINEIASKHPYISETEFCKIYANRTGKSATQKDIKAFRFATEDYRVR